MSTEPSSNDHLPSGMRDAGMVFCDTVDTPIGTLMLAADAQGAAADILDETARQLRDYFAGARRAFTLPLAPQGTAFQLRVWAALATIPFGVCWSYRELAQAIGQPAAVRAVGAANGRNPLPIVLPCHRVIGADGSLTGFGGGLPIKQALLRLEGALPAQEAAAQGMDDLFA
jgi:O-6-methylguanine DNA methyltransferase